MNRLELLEQIAEVAGKMRVNQREYFAKRDHGSLIRSKQLETVLDGLLVKLKNTLAEYSPVEEQAGLFAA